MVRVDAAPDAALGEVPTRPGQEYVRVNEAESTNAVRTPAGRVRIEIKVTEAQKDLFARAASAKKQGMSEFVRTCAEEAAQEILKRR